VSHVPSWQDQAACRFADPALFHGPDEEDERSRIRRERNAKAICAGCPVRAECLALADNRRDAHGIWGGLNEDERRKRTRNLQRAARLQVAA
jgi:WhiB family redox-sensing transcriptional regulator